MTRKQRYYGLFGLMILISMIFFPPFASAVQFTAETTETYRDSTKSGKIYVQDSQYRMDTKDNGEDIIVLVDQAKGETVVIAPSQKMYRKMETQSMSSLMNDPFQVVVYMETNAQKHLTGTESINGYECEKYVFRMQDLDVMTAWVSTKLQFPIKIDQPSNQRSMLLNNIKEGSVDSTLFAIPAEYNEYVAPEKKPIPPGITDTVNGEAPWQRRISAGGEIRVKTNPKVSVRVKVMSLVKDETMVTVVPFREGKPIGIEMGDDTTKKHTFKGKGFREEYLFGLQHHVEEVRIKVEKGILNAEVSHEDSFNKLPYKESFVTYYQMAFLLKPDENMRLTMTGDSQDQPESKLTLTHYKGEDAQKEEVGHEDVILKNGETKSWTFTPEQGLSSIGLNTSKDAGVRIRIERFKGK